MMLMKPILLLSALAAADAAERKFVDAKGTEHVTFKDKPKVVMFAHRAVSMRHYGKHDSVVWCLFDRTI